MKTREFIVIVFMIIGFSVLYRQNNKILNYLEYFDTKIPAIYDNSTYAPLIMEDLDYLKDISKEINTNVILKGSD